MLQLLSTDFDGTLVGGPRYASCPDDFADLLAEHKRAGGLWAINTGRCLWHAEEGIDQFASPVPPDFVLTNEREVFRKTAGGSWEAHGNWNAECERRHASFFARSRGLFTLIESELANFRGLQIIREEGRMAGFVAADEPQMETAAALLLELAAGEPEFSFQRNTVYLRFCHADYDKGTALAELCRLEGVSRDAVFAAGDHHNDLPMLKADIAAALACPSNAIPEVKTAVLSGGGYVATRPVSAGIADALAHFMGRQPETGRPVEQYLT